MYIILGLHYVVMLLLKLSVASLALRLLCVGGGKRAWCTQFTGGGGGGCKWLGMRLVIGPLISALPYCKQQKVSGGGGEKAS